ncbi:MAG: plasmid pRiA4b ORF-3 family protein [Opitutaceae bacterium]|jgi:hypothetical protein
MAKHPIKPESAGTLMQLKVTLCGSRPSIWRRLLVPADIKLSKLHAVLQTSMGWEESHLHVFRHEDKTYEPAAHRQLGGGFFVPDENQDEAKVRLADLLHAKGDWLVYEYDFGDGWEHEVRVEKIVPVGSSNAHRAVCLAGARACPPEDCGGLPGYDHLLKIIANPKHSEHHETLEWLGGTFAPEAFDAARVDASLLKLKL